MLFKKTLKQIIGDKSENLALSHLKKEGLTLVTRNYHCKHGEVDLIMREGDYLVFIEVRYRKNTDFGGALSSITPNKQQKIIKTALSFLQDKQYKGLHQLSPRFDVIAIEGDNANINWVKSAFDGN